MGSVKIADDWGRPQNGHERAQDTPVSHEEPFAGREHGTDHDGPQDGHPLDAVREWLGRYLLTVNDSDLDLLTVWAVHTHLVEETYTSPRLLLDSPVPGSGKTTALEHLARLCVQPVQMASVSSPALLVRILEGGMRTLLIDEADRTLRPDNPTTPDLVAILNAGYKRGATRPVLVNEKGKDWSVKEMPTYAPVALAGNSPNLPEDTRTRTIRVLLLPDLNGTVEESDWELIEDDARGLGDWIAWWADAHRAYVSAVRPEMPEGITGRFREKWQPLARVAAVAGGRWPAVVGDLAVQDREQVEMDRQDGMVTTRPHVLLLQHLADVWPADNFAPTTDLVDLLIEAHPEVWGAESSYGKPLTAQRLGRMMAQHFKVNTCRQPDGDRARGYLAAALRPVWTRMAVEVPSGSAGSSGSSGSSGTHRGDGAGTPESCRLHGLDYLPNACVACSTITGTGLAS